MVRSLLLAVVPCSLVACTTTPPRTSSHAAATTTARCPAGLATDDMLQLAVDDSHAYWLTGDAIRRVAKAGGATETLAEQARGVITSFVLDAGALDYTHLRDRALGPADLWQQPITDPASAVTLATVSDMRALATSATDTYWRTGAFVVALNGGAPRIVHAFNTFDAAPEAGFRVDDTRVYYQKQANGLRSLFALDLVPRREQRLAGPIAARPFFEQDADALYWVIVVDGEEQLQRVPKNGDAPSVVATTPDHLGPLRSNGDTVVYQDWERHFDPDFGDFVFTGALVAAPVNAGSGAATTISDCTLDGVTNLAVDATTVYWTNDCADCADATTTLYAQPLP